jgi:hypothetical protein
MDPCSTVAVVAGLADTELAGVLEGVGVGIEKALGEEVE